MNILVVDDDREIVDSIAIFLSGENYTVLKAYWKNIGLQFS